MATSSIIEEIKLKDKSIKRILDDKELSFSNVKPFSSSEIKKSEEESKKFIKCLFR
jgi:hypothetical protein